MLALALLACGADAPTTDPTACAPLVWYADADGDGFGDDRQTVEACEAPAGRVATGGDCDDARDTVWPGAPPVCDDRDDDDCDGIVDEPDADLDGDGQTACAGDCDDADPARNGGATETCDGGVDDDCDGLVDDDDDSVDPWSCGYCPPMADFEATYRRRRDKVNPCVLDPTVSLCRDGTTEIDTLEDGERLHYVTWSKMDWGHRPELLLYLPPGPGNHTEQVADWGAYAGYRLIVLGWPNDGVTQEVCRHATDRTCYDGLRRERLYGEDASDLAEVAPNDSIVGRLITLLRWLAIEHPDEGWGDYLDGDEVRWDRVIGAGWSEGGTMIAYLGKDHALAGELLLAPGLDLYSNPDFTKTPDAWWDRPGLTPPERIYALHSIYDPQAWPIDQFTPVLSSLGVTDAPVSIDTSRPPYRDSHHLVTGSIEWDKGEQCTTHGMIAVDGCIDEDVLMPAYFYVYCTLPGLSAPSP